MDKLWITFSGTFLAFKYQYIIIYKHLIVINLKIKDPPYLYI